MHIVRAKLTRDPSITTGCAYLICQYLEHVAVESTARVHGRGAEISGENQRTRKGGLCHIKTYIDTLKVAQYQAALPV